MFTHLNQRSIGLTRSNPVKKSKHQKRFEELRMGEDEQFIYFYTKLQDLVNFRTGLRGPLKPV